MPLPTLTRLRAWLLALRPGPADHSSAAGRGRDRLRRVAWSALSSAGVSAAGLLVSLLSIPLAIHYLGQERYGIWITLSSLLSWLSLTDFGMGGAALVTLIAEAKGRDDVPGIRALVSTAFVSMATLALILIAVLELSQHRISWPAIFNASPAVDPTELKAAVRIGMGLFALTLPAGTICALCSGLQESYRANLLLAASHLVSLGALIVVSRYEASLSMLVTAMVGSRTLVMWTGTLVFFSSRYRRYRPAWRSTSRPVFGLLVQRGWKYLLQQIAGAFIFQSQPFILSQMINPAAAGVYQVTSRVLTIPVMLTQFVCLPLIPAYGEANTRQDQPWMIKTLRRSVRAGLLAGLLVIPMALALNPLIRAFLKPEMVPPTALTLAMALYVIVNCIITALAVYHTGLGRLGGQAAAASLHAVTLLSTALLLVPRLGLDGMGVAILLGILINAAAQYAMLHWNQKNKAGVNSL